MKNMSCFRASSSWRALLSGFVLIQLFSYSLALRAATLTWSSSGVSPATDGGGSWNATGGTNWLNGTTPGAWVNGSDAAIGAGNGAAGTITVGAVTADSITFNAPGSGNYLLTSGTITLTGSVALIANANATIASTLAGTAGMIKSGLGVITISGSNIYTGLTSVNGGELDLDSASGLAVPGSITLTSGTVRLFLPNQIATNATVTLSAGGNGAFGGVFDIQGYNQTVANVTVGYENTAVGLKSPYEILGSGGTLTSSNAFNMQSGYVSANLGGSVGLNKTIYDTLLTLAGTNTYTGTTLINGGGIDLGGGSASGSLASGTLTLAGGAFNYTRTGNTSQSFTTTNILVGGTNASYWVYNSGGNSISVVKGDTLSLGAITRSVGGTIDFANSLGSITTTNANTGGILGGWATYNPTTWAVANGGSAITGLSTYTTTGASGTTAGNYTGNNIDVTNSAGALSGVITPDSLRFNTPGANTLALAAGNNIIGTGGILVTPYAGSSVITGGTLEGAAGADLIVIQNNNTQNNAANGLTIASVIADNTSATGLTKAGPGNLTLTGTNTYTGITTIDAGTLTLAGGVN